MNLARVICIDSVCSMNCHFVLRIIQAVVVPSVPLPELGKAATRWTRGMVFGIVSRHIGQYFLPMVPIYIDIGLLLVWSPCSIVILDHTYYGIHVVYKILVRE